MKFSNATFEIRNNYNKKSQQGFSRRWWVDSKLHMEKQRSKRSQNTPNGEEKVDIKTYKNTRIQYIKILNSCMGGVWLAHANGDQSGLGWQGRGDVGSWLVSSSLVGKVPLGAGLAKRKGHRMLAGQPTTDWASWPAAVGVIETGCSGHFGSSSILVPGFLYIYK